jgi:hypothetical protein
MTDKILIDTNLFEPILCICLFSVLVSFVISDGTAWGETVTGVVKSAEALDHTIRKWKSHAANTASKQGRNDRHSVQKRGHKLSEELDKKDTKKHTSYGAFCWCMTSEKKAPIRYAYTYGEADSEVAGKKAVSVFDADKARGRCLKPPRLLRITSDNL